MTFTDEEIEKASRVANPRWWADYDTRGLHGAGATWWEVPWGLGKEEILANMRAALTTLSSDPPALLATDSGWRPIETAQKKLGEFVDLWVEYRTVVNGKPYEFKAERYALARWVDWNTGVGRWIDNGGNDIEWRDEETDGEDTILRERKVTHWQPLPAAPGVAATVQVSDLITLLTTITAEPEPIDMVLFCPACGKQHIDAPVEVPGHGMGGEWTNPPHRSHLCAGCGHIWRPADVATNGVAAVSTQGKADSPIVSPALLAARERLEEAACAAYPGGSNRSISWVKVDRLRDAASAYAASAYAASAYAASLAASLAATVTGEDA